MSKHVTRRDLLKLAGGSALGMLLTPLPWKLVDDSAIWTQNWSLVPPLPRGRIGTRLSVCTICPANCPVRARCVGADPVSLAGIPGHPFGDGALCPIGLAGHHMAFHPARIRRPWRRVPRGDGHEWEPASREEILNVVAQRVRASGGRPAAGVLDLRPGRCQSDMYRQFLARTGRGTYLISHQSEDGTLRQIRRQSTPDPGPLAYDIANAGLVLSFGATLFEGWGSPPSTRKVFAAERRPRIVQIGARQSATALRADLWVPVRPGTEEVLALGIGRMLLDRRIPDGSMAPDAPGMERYRARVAAYTPEYVCRETGIDGARFQELVRMMNGTGPAVAIGGSDPAGGPPGRSAATAIAALNVIAGSVNVRGGIVPRALPDGLDSGNGEEQAAMEIRDLPTGSLDLLVLDDAGSGLAMPGEAIRRAVDPDRGVIVAFSPYLAGAALCADVVIPVPAPYESAEEVYSPVTEPSWAMGISAPLFAKADSQGVRESFLDALLLAMGAGGEAIARIDDRIGRRLESIAGSDRGRLIRAQQDGGDAGSSPTDPAVIRSEMLNGAWWISRAPVPGRPVVTAILPVDGAGEPGAPAHRPARESGDLILLPVGWKCAAGGAAVPALASKLYQESDLRRAAGHASINPATAGAAGIGRDPRVRVVTRRGSMAVTLHRDDRVMPGVIELACGPTTRPGGGTGDPLAICETDADGVWYATEAHLESL
jgi:menaquinone reductase, molybdopterin-binding-like subunit